MTRSPAGALEGLGIAHAIVGVLKFRRELRGIVNDGVFNAVGNDPQRNAALWFLMVAPPLWLSGHLLRHAESADDQRTQLVAGSTLIGTGLLGVVVLPKSPFAAVIGVGVASVLKSRRATA